MNFTEEELLWILKDRKTIIKDKNGQRAKSKK